MEEDELAEMSFAEQYANRVSSRKKERPNDNGQNGYGSRHVGSPGSPLQRDVTSKKKGGILSLAQSLRISDSVDYSIRSMEIHQNGNPDSMHLDGLKFGSSGEGILAASLREEQQRLKETIEKEKQLSEGLKLLHLKHYDQALGCLEPLQEYYKTDARKMSALLSYLAECHLYQDIHNVDNFNTFKAKHSSERQALMSSVSDLIQEGLKQYESAIRDGYAEDYAWEVKAWTLYGTALFHQGDPHEALQALTSALESEKKLVVQLTDYERAYLLSKMADAEFLVHHKEDSLESCKLAAEIFGEGRLFHPPSEEDAELFESWSLKHYQEAMDLCLKLAERFKDLKAYEEELEVLKDGISMTVDFQDIQGLLRLQLAKAYQLISAGYLHIGKLSNAEEAGHQAVKLYQEETSHLLHIEISRCLFNVGVAKLRVRAVDLVSRLRRCLDHHGEEPATKVSRYSYKEQRTRDHLCPEGTGSSVHVKVPGSHRLL